MIKHLFLLLFAAATTLHAALPVPRGSNPRFLGEADGGALFFVEGDDGFPDLWRTDGTPAGTQLVSDLGTQTFDLPNVIGMVNGKLLYQQQTTAIYAVDGTSTTKIASLAGGAYASDSTALFGGVLYFGIGYAVWRSDGTEAGTYRVDAGMPENSLPFEFAADGDTLFIVARNPFRGFDVYARHGAEGAFSRATLVFGSGGDVMSTQAVGRRLYLTIRSSGDRYTEMFVTDGTNAGTYMLRRFSQFSARSVRTIGGAGERGLLVGYHETTGLELWSSDGTEAGTQLLDDFAPGPHGSDPWRVGSDGARTYVQVSDERELQWITAIDAAATVTRLAPLGQGASASPGVVWNGRFFFPVTTLSAGTELWVSDGTPAGTHRVVDLFRGPGSGASQTLIATSHGVLFGGDDGTTGTEPWITDGTPQGTRLLKNIRSEGEPQSDDDGVLDATEDGGVWRGDADLDGRPDRLSPFVANVWYAVMATCELRQARRLLFPRPLILHQQVVLTAVEFQLPCASASVFLIYERLSVVSPRTRLFAYAREVGGDETTARWFPMPGVTFQAGPSPRALFTLTDGGPGDDSPAGDGWIVHRSFAIELPPTRDRSVAH